VDTKRLGAYNPPSEGYSYSEHLRYRKYFIETNSGSSILHCCDQYKTFGAIFS
jgi:hypothetical protein